MRTATGSATALTFSPLLAAATLALACALLAGCAPGIRSVVFRPGLEPRPTSYEILVFSEQRPECPFDEVGTVSAEGGSLLSSERFLRGFKEAARSMGGDAIMGVQQGTAEGGTIRTRTGTTTSRMTTLTGTVIRFRDLSCRR